MNSSINADPKELHTFDSAAQDWWNTQGIFKTLHDINPLRLRFISENTPLNNKTILDVGCGGGILTESLAKQGAVVTGIDLSEAALAVAKNHATQENLNINYQSITVEELAELQPASFDLITCMELLEHVPDPASIIAACAKLLKPGGEIYFSTINRNPKAYAFAILGAEYLLKMLPKGMHSYDKFIKPSELAAWLRSSDLELLRIAGITYNPFNHCYRLSHQIDVNYMVHCKL